MSSKSNSPKKEKNNGQFFGSIKPDVMSEISRLLGSKMILTLDIINLAIENCKKKEKMLVDTIMCEFDIIDVKTAETHKCGKNASLKIKDDNEKEHDVCHSCAGKKCVTSAKRYSPVKKSVEVN